MANPQKGELDVEVDGKTYRLKPTFNAFCEVEPLVGKSGDEVVDDLMREGSKARFSGIRAVMWCFLQEYHSAEIVTLKDAAAWVQRVGALNAMHHIRDVIKLSADTDGASSGAEDRPTSAQDGTTAPSTSGPVVPA